MRSRWPRGGALLLAVITLTSGLAVEAADPAQPPAARSVRGGWRAATSLSAEPDGTPYATPAGLAAVPPRGASAPATVESEMVERAALVLDELAKIPLHGIPRNLLTNAEGLVIVPAVFKAGFIVGGRFGHGLLVVREANGKWSAPVFLRLAGGSVGWQVGAQSTDVVLVIRRRRALDSLLGGSKFTLGADASVAAGPVGRQAAAGTDLTLKSEIFSYSRTRGLFVGLSLDGSALAVDREANGSYYGRTGVSPSDILALRDRNGQPLSIRESTSHLHAMLEEHATPEVADRPGTAPGPIIE